VNKDLPTAGPEILYGGNMVDFKSREVKGRRGGVVRRGVGVKGVD